jgi:pentatricopeptide repeat protein
MDEKKEHVTTKPYPTSNCATPNPKVNAAAENKRVQELLYGCKQVRNLKVALDLYESMVINGIEIFEKTYNNFVEVCIRCDELQIASEFLQEMEDMGISIRSTVLDEFLD